MSKAGNMPSAIVAGESIWLAEANTAQSRSDITFDDYTPAGGYSLAYQFASATPVTAAAVANGAATGWTLEVTSAQTLAWRAGPMAYTAFATHTETGRKFAVESGYIAVTASPLAVSAWTAVVAACDAAILSGASRGKISTSIDGMSVSYSSVDQLITLRDYARMMERNETGNRPRRIIRTRFT